MVHQSVPEAEEGSQFSAPQPPLRIGPDRPIRPVCQPEPLQLPGLRVVEEVLRCLENLGVKIFLFGGSFSAVEGDSSSTMTSGSRPPSSQAIQACRSRLGSMPPTQKTSGPRNACFSLPFVSSSQTSWAWQRRECRSGWLSHGMLPFSVVSCENVIPHGRQRQAGKGGRYFSGTTG